MKSHGDKFNLILQELSRAGRQWDERVSPQLLLDESLKSMDVEPTHFGDMLWKGRLDLQDAGFILTGSWEMNMPRQCGRCNVAFTAKVSGDIMVKYVLGEHENGEEQAELELAGDEPEVLEAPGVLNVLDVLREHFWLAWQPMVVCSEDCKGLCLQCGVDLNKGDCNCHQKVKENPFAALKDFKFDA